MSGEGSDYQGDSTQNRLVDLVEYVEHMVRLGEKPVFALSQYRQLHYHEATLKGRIGIRHDQADEDGPIWLSIDRLKRIDPPDVIEQIQVWITVSPDPFTEPVVESVRTQTIPKTQVEELIAQGILDEEDVQPALRPGQYGEEEEQEQVGLCDVIFRLTKLPEIEADVRAYVEGPWREWSEAEKPRRETIKIYDDFFSLQQSIQAMDGEEGLEVVWGMGMARWRLDDGLVIDHPLVVQLVEIDMDTMSGRINIRPRSTEPQVALKPFFALENPGADQVHAFAKNFFASFPEDDDISPFQGKTFEPILREAASRLQGEARYHPDDLADIADRKLPPIDKTMRVTNTWVVFARQRSDNFYINDLERLKKAIEDAEELPGPAKRLVTEPSSQTTYTPTIIDVGLPGTSGPSGGGGSALEPGSKLGIETTRTDDFFFPKPFNDDQISIIQRLNEADGLVAQGPPGTGKTHTIANIICHYLATGRRVLVTSKGESALTVLRDHIPEGIRDLTISLLTNERAGLKQLEQAVTLLANTATQMNPRRLEIEIQASQERIIALRKKIEHIDGKLAEWANRHLKLIGAGGGILPMELAQKIVGDRERHAWLPDDPGPETKYDPGFTEEDIAVVRDARKALGECLQYLGKELPSLSDLPDAAMITAVHEDLLNAKRLEADASDRDAPVLSLSAERVIERARKLLGAVERIVSVFKELEGEPWLQAIVEEWRDRGLETDELKLFNNLVPTMNDLAKRRQTVVSHAVNLPKGADGNNDLYQAVNRAAQGSRPFGLVSFGKSEARGLYDQIRIEGHETQGAEEWTKVAETLQWRRDMAALRSRWKTIAAEYHLPPLEDDMGKAGRWLASIVTLIERIGTFLDEDRKLIETEVSDLFPYGMIPADILRSRGGAESAAEIIRINLSKHRLTGSREKIGGLLERLRGCSGPVVEDMTDFVANSVGESRLTARQITDRWQELCRELSEIQALRPRMETVDRVARAISESGAPKWAKALRTLPVTEAGDPWTPGDWGETWNWRRQQTYLRQIDGRDEIRQLAKQRLQHEDELRKTFHKVVENRTFLSLKKSVTERVESALVMFTSAIRRIGKGTGIRAQRFRRDAREAMDNSYSAVPCWIMPTWRISESLPAVLGSFDLVIVDEASQSDIGALPALLRGKKALIVGDDKQVSPTGSFLDERRLLQLKHNFLQGQPFAPLMIPGGSLYELANAMFPGRRIMLHEHFRCVEPIIRFSMQFYTEPIIPLRIPKASERLDPPLVDVYIPDGRKSRSQINMAEADAIVDEIEKIVTDPAFDGRSIGVVSLIGPKQAHHIQTQLLSRIGEEAFVAHKIACGNPPTFQGKERDIMLVTMVECPETQSAKTALLWEQRFNVAFSRARDRMYLFRSVDEDQLRPDDLKAKAIRHFRSPMELAAPDVDDLIDLCDSEFERDVFRRLREAGYRVTPQVTAAKYSIDMVVEGEQDRRLAIELDGDQYHTPEKWADDLVRQRTLERMGWRFWRCWGSSFYLDPEACMDDLIRTLDSLAIKPLGGNPPRNVYTEHRLIEQPGVEALERTPAAEEQREMPLVEPAPSRSEALTEQERIQPRTKVADLLTTIPISPQAQAPELPRPEAAAEEEVENVEVGDRVLIAYNDEAGRQHTIRISDSEHAPDMHIIHKDFPLAEALIEACVDDEIEIPAGDGKRLVTILKVEKSAENLTKEDHRAVELEILEAAPAELNANGTKMPEFQHRVRSQDGRRDSTASGADSSETAKTEGAQEGEHVSTGGSPADESIVPYINWSSRPLPDSRNTSPMLIAAAFKEIVEAEGPILALRAYRLYVRAAGLKKVGPVIRQEFDRVLSSEISRGTFVAAEEFSESQVSRLIIRHPDQPAVIVRTIGDRIFDEIPPSEIAAVMCRHETIKVDGNLDLLFRAVLQQYGLKRMTSHVYKELSRIYSEHISNDNIDE